MKKTIIWTDICIHIALLLLVTITFNLLLSSCLFAFHKTISWYHLPLSFMISLIFCHKIFKEKFCNILMESAIALTIIVFTSVLMVYFYDTSWDGNAYHKLAVGLLKNHWNPLYELPLHKSEKLFGTKVPCLIWCECYCKATWILGASIYSLTDNIECAKSYTLIGMICAFLSTLYFLKKKGVNNFLNFLFALLGALTPVAIAQVVSFYVDGFLHLILYILLISLLMLYDTEQLFDKRISICLLSTSMIICGNIKFTGLLYGGFFCIMYYLYDSCNEYFNNPKNRIQTCLKRVGYYALLAFITIFIVGSSTYLTNFIHHGSFTYPLTGEGKIDIMTSQSPFNEANHLKNFFLSIFSPMDNFKISSGKVPSLKFPFTMNVEEFRHLIKTDLRLSGFGILFSGIFLIVILILFLELYRMKKNKKFYMILLNLFICFGLTLGIKESWWARYAPYVYFVVLIGLYVGIGSKREIIRYVSDVAIVVLLVNNILFETAVSYTLHESVQIDKNLKELKKEGEIDVYNNFFPGIYFNLKDQNIPYNINSSLCKDEAHHLNYYGNIDWHYGNILWNKKN